MYSGSEHACFHVWAVAFTSRVTLDQLPPPSLWLSFISSKVGVVSPLEGC